MSAIEEIQQLSFGGKTARVFELKHDSGSTAVISNYGCILMKLIVKDKQGFPRDVVLGFDCIAEYLGEAYLRSYPFFGAIIGRYANRIKGASFELDGSRYHLSDNNNGATLHGGFSGFDKKIWDVTETKPGDNPAVTFQYRSAANEEGFPGSLLVTFTVELSSDSFTYSIHAETDAPTAVNLSYHPYFNLDENKEAVHNQQAKIYAAHWLEQDEDFCLTGNLVPTANSGYDFSTWKPISQEWNKEDGYDQSFVALKKSRELSLMAEAISSDRNLRMQVLSTEPVVHFYTGKWIPHVTGKHQAAYRPFSGYCFETHNYPNAVNIPAFPSSILRPGEIYRQTTTYQFM